MSRSIIALAALWLGSATAGPQLPPQEPLCAVNSYTVVPNNGSGIWPYRTYRSSDATPPTLNITRTGQALAPGFIFLGVENANNASPGENQERAVIITDQGDLVWAGPEGETSNFHKQTLNGETVLTLWIGDGQAAAKSVAGHGYGAVHILDSSYKTLYTVCPNIPVTFPTGINGTCITADLHESKITDRGTILVTVYNTTTADLTSVGGPKDGWVLNPLAVEVDIATNEALFIWSPLEHVPLTASKLPFSGDGSFSDPYDYFHMNSIDLYDGKYYINGRHTWTTYYVDTNGDILWQIEGDTGGDFGPLPEDGKFSWQHDARIYPYGSDNTTALLTYFANDNVFPVTGTPSVALSLVVQLPPNKSVSPRVLQHLINPSDQVTAWAEGSNQILDNGHHFVDYGIHSVMAEYIPSPPGAASVTNGTAIWTASFGYVSKSKPNGQSYRGFKQIFSAVPAGTEISLVVGSAPADDACAPQSSSDVRGYVSWNGWTPQPGQPDAVYELLAGSSPSDLQFARIIPKKGFETAFTIPSDAKYVQVQVSSYGPGPGQQSGNDWTPGWTPSQDWKRWGPPGQDSIVIGRSAVVAVQ